MTRGGAGNLVALGFGLLLVLAPSGIGRGARPQTDPTIPVGQDGAFLGNLSTATVGSSGSGTLQFSVGDPLSTGLANVTVTFGFYAYSAGLGDPTGSVPADGVCFTAPGSGTGCALSASVVVGSVPAGGARSDSVAYQAAGGAPVGTYLVRSALTFSVGGSSEAFESRGYFSSAQWAAAALPNGANGAPGLNLSVLGVDGITPETSVSVAAPSALFPLGAVAAAGVVLVAVGAYALWRRGPGSRSGAGTADEPQSAPSALGKNRTSDGERSSS